MVQRHGCESSVSCDSFNIFFLLFFPSRKPDLLQRASERSSTYKACFAKSVDLVSFSYPVPRLCPYS